MNWTAIDGILPMREARPKVGVCYFIVESEEGWSACLSLGTSYKRVVALKDGIDSENEAKTFCNNHHENKTDPRL